MGLSSCADTKTKCSVAARRRKAVVKAAVGMLSLMHHNVANLLL